MDRMVSGFRSGRYYCLSMALGKQAAAAQREDNAMPQVLPRQIQKWQIIVRRAAMARLAHRASIAGQDSKCPEGFGDRSVQRIQRNGSHRKQEVPRVGITGHTSSSVAATKGIAA